MEKFPGRCRTSRIVKMDNGNSYHEPESRVGRFVAHKLYMHDRCSRYFQSSKTHPSCPRVWGMMATKNRVGEAWRGRMLDIFNMNFYCHAANVCDITWELTNTVRVQWFAGSAKFWRRPTFDRSKIWNSRAAVCYKSICAFCVANAAITARFVLRTKVYCLHFLNSYNV